jgi:hypothetical protein
MERLERLGIRHCFGGTGGGGGTVATPAEVVEQGKINQELWDYYLETYKPQIEKYAAMKTDPAVAAAEKNQVAGQINAEIMSKTPAGGAENPVNTARTLSGIGKIGAAADVQGQGAARSRTLSGMQSVIDIGRGQETSVDVGLRQLSGESVRTAISNASSDRLEAEATGEAYGSVAGALAAGALKYYKPKG